MKPPFHGTKVVNAIRLEDVYPYIDNNFLFKGQWQFKKNKLSEEAYQKMLKDKAYPVLEDWKRRCIDEKILEPKVAYGYFKRVDLKKLSCSNVISARETIPLQLVTVGEKVVARCKDLFDSCQYTDYLYLHGLAVVTAEALAEYWHGRILNELGIAFDDKKPMPVLSRISPGYPIWPDLNDQIELCRLLDAQKIGVSLTENLQLVPEFSTSAMILL